MTKSTRAELFADSRIRFRAVPGFTRPPVRKPLKNNGHVTIDKALRQPVFTRKQALAGIARHRIHKYRRLLRQAAFAHGAQENGGSLDLLRSHGAGALTAEDSELPPRSMTIFANHPGIVVKATQPSIIAIVGGQPVGPRFIEWNFVSSRRERIESAKRDWLLSLCGTGPGESERPERREQCFVM